MRIVSGTFVLLFFFLAPFIAYAQNICQLSDAACSSPKSVGNPCPCFVPGSEPPIIPGVCIAVNNCQATGVSAAASQSSLFSFLTSNLKTAATAIGGLAAQTFLSSGSSAGTAQTSLAALGNAGTFSSSAASLPASFFEPSNVNGVSCTNLPCTAQQIASEPSPPAICGLISSCTMSG